MGLSHSQITKTRTLIAGKFVEKARGFFHQCSDCRDGKKAISRFKYEVQFKLNGKSVFWARRSGIGMEVRSGDISHADLTFDTDASTYVNLFDGSLTPTDMWFSGRLKLPGFGLKRVGYARLLSLIRICQGRYFWRR